MNIDVIYQWNDGNDSYKMYTDDLKYEDNLEIIFDVDKNCFVVKKLEKIKEKWNSDHGISNDPFDNFMEYEDGMQDM